MLTMKHLDITFDLETLSLESNAAVLQLGAVAWNRHADSPETLLVTESTPTFQTSVDLRTCVGSGFDFDLTGRENIFLNGAILGYSEAFLNEKYDEIVAFSELGQFIHVPLRNYSSGMVMRLAFSVATMVNPDILIVDEILAVGDAAFQAKSKARMTELMQGGTTVLFVSHDLGQIREMCDRAIWLEHGEMKMQGEVNAVCDAYQSAGS